VKLANTTVTVLNAKDSVLRAFTWAGDIGAFSSNKLGKGKFILLITYPGYADYVEDFTLDSVKHEHDFGVVNMILKSRLLADVIVKGEVTAIKIKGDTTEFNARAYKIQPNDKVEDLLRQLPGIQVDKDGKITAQGQTVSKVLVDGEEFFGDDPTLVTKNIRADMVDKVQLYDKKSDQAAFTGIDDGVKTKTINIKLKEDKKNGLFGSTNTNIGTSGYYEGQLQFNKFKAKEKFAVYGTAANDGRTGLGFQDASNLGVSNNNVQFMDGGGIMITNDGSNDALDSFSGYYDGKGVPVTTSGGVHYNTSWNNDKESINTNYKIGAITLTGLTTTNTQQNLPTGIINNTSNKNFNDYAFRQKLDLIYQIKLDTSSNLKISTDATAKNFRVNNDYTTETDNNGTLLNRNSRRVNNHGNAQIFDLSAFYTKKFHKVGRTLSWNVSEAYNQNKTDGYLNSVTDFYNSKKAVDSTETINQYKPTKTTSSVLNSNITYSEPISKRFTVLFNYGFGIDNNSSNNQSYNQSSPGVYNVLDATYSNYYKFNQLTNQIGAIFNYKKDKTIFNFGTKVSDDSYKQINEYTGDAVKRSFINWNPQAMYQHRFSQQSALTINYSGNATQPSIQQIQPVLVNTDPLNIVVGNPDLKPSFSNEVYGYYNSYKVISGQQLFINGLFSNTLNAIVNNTSIDTKGKNTTQYVNLKGNDPYNYYLYANLGRKIKPIDLYVGLNLNTSGSVSYSYINNVLDRGTSHSYGVRLALQKYVEKKYNFEVEAGPSYTYSSMSLQPLINNNAAGFTTNGNFDLYLPLKFGLGSNARYTYTAQTQAFSAQYLTIWNAYVFKTFLKDDKLKISLSANDLLNQNSNFSRGISNNTATQTNTSGIRRFFMLSVTWDFTKFGTVAASKN
jgi:hypothetical protein